MFEEAYDEVQPSDTHLARQSHLTAISRNKVSLPLSVCIKAGLIPQGSSILHHGSGRPDNPDSNALWRQSADAHDWHNMVVNYDPYFSADEGVNLGQYNFDIVYCQYVLNTVPTSMRWDIWRQTARSLKIGGAAIFVARPRKQINQRAEKAGWKRHHDGGWVVKSGRSDVRYQRGYDGEELAEESLDEFGRAEIVEDSSRFVIVVARHE